MFVLFLSSPTIIFAESDYVLPYPSAMPGSIWYKIHLVQERLEQFWYFGSFGQFDYSLKEADKYLVEAKTLFEYKQYLLADVALKKSDTYFGKLSHYLDNAKRENKNISEKEKILKDAALKHLEILNMLKKELPENFMWRPEKTSATSLTLLEDIEAAIKIRNMIGGMNGEQ